MGLRPVRRRPPVHCVRRPHSERQVRSQRTRLGLGRQHQLGREARHERSAASAAGRGRGRGELLQRRADRCRPQEQSGQRRHAGPRRGARRFRPRRLPRSHVELAIHHLGRLLARRHHEQQRSGGQRIQKRPVLFGQSAVHAREERARGRRAAVGQA